MKVICETSDYSIFRKLDGNREVTPKRVNEIETSIQAIGWISNPIVVNEKMEVIDGQGRIEAMRKLGLPVEYVIHEGAGLKECQEMNMHSTNWTTKELVKSLAISGHDGCKKLYDLMDEFELPMTYIANVLRLNRTVVRRNIKSIEITDDEYKEARYVISELKKYLPVVGRFSKRVDCTSYAIAYCVRHGVDTEKMLSALRKADKDTMNFTSVERAIKSLQEAYNYGKKGKKNRIYIYESYRKGE